MKNALFFNKYLMNSTILLAQIFGPFCIIIGLSLVFHWKMFTRWLEDLKEHFIFLYSFWFFTFLLWMYMFLIVPTFLSPMEIILKAFWLIIAIKWTILILFPKFTKTMIRKSRIILKYSSLFWVIFLLLWVYLSYLAY